MAIQIPSASDVRKALADLERGQLQELADKSNVPITTLTNIRKSTSEQGPTVDTLRKFWPHLLRLLAKKTAA